jgi:hypothetical protein
MSRITRRQLHAALHAYMQQLEAVVPPASPEQIDAELARIMRPDDNGQDEEEPWS